MFNKSALNFIAGMLIMVGLSSCSFESPKSSDKHIIPSFVVVNVLDQDSFDDCRIKGSINIPFMDLKEYAQDHWDKNATEIVIHCSNYSCGASSEGYKMLTKLGFKNVWAFEGGTAEAKEAGVEVEGPCTQSYLNDFKKPEMYVEKESVATISVENLKKKIEEFAIKSKL